MREKVDGSIPNENTHELRANRFDCIHVNRDIKDSCSWYVRSMKAYKMGLWGISSRDRNLHLSIIKDMNCIDTNTLQD